MGRKLREQAAAEYLNNVVTVRTLQKKRVSGGGPDFFKLGSTVVYDTDDLDTWVESHRRTSTTDAGNQAA